MLTELNPMRNHFDRPDSDESGGESTVPDPPPAGDQCARWIVMRATGLRQS